MSNPQAMMMMMAATPRTAPDTKTAPLPPPSSAPLPPYTLANAPKHSHPIVQRMIEYAKEFVADVDIRGKVKSMYQKITTEFGVISHEVHSEFVKVLGNSSDATHIVPVATEEYASTRPAATTLADLPPHKHPIVQQLLERVKKFAPSLDIRAEVKKLYHAVDSEVGHITHAIHTDFINELAKASDAKHIIRAAVSVVREEFESVWFQQLKIASDAAEDVDAQIRREYVEIMSKRTGRMYL